MAKKPVQEPYKSANQWWYEDALQAFWRKYNGGMVTDNAKKPYRQNNPGGGENRGENARILINDRNIKIIDIQCTNADLGDCVWFFTVKSARDGNKSYQPKIKFQSRTYTDRWHNGADHKITVAGSIVEWSCDCWDFRKNKPAPCKHILSSSVAVLKRIEGTRSGRLKK